MIPTYAIGGEGKWIQCLDCGAISYNPNDVRERYCGNCHEFHDYKETRAVLVKTRIEEMHARVKEHFAETPAEEAMANAEQAVRMREGKSGN